MKKQKKNKFLFVYTTNCLWYEYNEKTFKISNTSDCYIQILDWLNIKYVQTAVKMWCKFYKVSNKVNQQTFRMLIKLKPN